MLPKVLIFLTISILNPFHCNLALSAAVKSRKPNETKPSSLWWSEIDDETLQTAQKSFKNHIVQDGALTFELGTASYKILNSQEQPEIISEDHPEYHEQMRKAMEWNERESEKSIIQSKKAFEKLKRNPRIDLYYKRPFYEFKNKSPKIKEDNSKATYYSSEKYMLKSKNEHFRKQQKKHSYRTYAETPKLYSFKESQVGDDNGSYLYYNHRTPPKFIYGSYNVPSDNWMNSVAGEKSSLVSNDRFYSDERYKKLNFKNETSFQQPNAISPSSETESLKEQSSYENNEASYPFNKGKSVEKFYNRTDAQLNADVRSQQQQLSSTNQFKSDQTKAHNESEEQSTLRYGISANCTPLEPVPHNFLEMEGKENASIDLSSNKILPISQNKEPELKKTKEFVNITDPLASKQLSQVKTENLNVKIIERNTDIGSPTFITTEKPPQTIENTSVDPVASETTELGEISLYKNYDSTTTLPASQAETNSTSTEKSRVLGEEASEQHVNESHSPTEQSTTFQPEFLSESSARNELSRRKEQVSERNIDAAISSQQSNALSTNTNILSSVDSGTVHSLQTNVSGDLTLKPEFLELSSSIPQFHKTTPEQNNNSSNQKSVGDNSQGKLQLKDIQLEESIKILEQKNNQTENQKSILVTDQIEQSVGTDNDISASLTMETSTQKSGHSLSEEKSTVKVDNSSLVSTPQKAILSSSVESPNNTTQLSASAEIESGNFRENMTSQSAEPSTLQQIIDSSEETFTNDEVKNTAESTIQIQMKNQNLPANTNDMLLNGEFVFKTPNTIVQQSFEKGAFYQNQYFQTAPSAFPSITGPFEQTHTQQFNLDPHNRFLKYPQTFSQSNTPFPAIHTWNYVPRTWIPNFPSQATQYT